MPTQPTKPQATIDEAVKRYLSGEQVATLCKYYKISRPGFYLWVKKYKERELDNARRNEHATPRAAETADKRTLLAELELLRTENRKLRDKLLSEMLKSGTI